MAGRKEMTHYERLSTALQAGTPDRVPVVLTAPLFGAMELGLGPQEYFRRAENVAEGQMRFVQRVGHDNVDSFFYFATEARAFGVEIRFMDNQPPAFGSPVLETPSQIDALEAPDPRTSEPLREVLRATELLANRARGKWLVIARALGPCSLPLPLMGIEAWLDLLLFGDERRRQHLLQVTSQFSTAWARALLAAGADVVEIVEPMASSTMLTREQSARLALPAVRRVVKDIRGPVVFWSLGAIQPVADLIPDLGVRSVSTDPTDDIREVKRLVGGRLGVLGGLNDLAMLTWTAQEAEEAAHRAIEAGAPGGGFVLSHQYEIPVGVRHDVLAAVVEAARKWGQYPDGKKQISARQ